MKGKKALYILAPAVLLIWGYIIFQIVSVSSDGSVKMKSSQGRLDSAKAVIEYEQYELLLDYDDPFLHNPRTSVPKRKVVSRPKPVNKPEKKQALIHWPIIIFVGEIINEQSEMKVYIVRINGHEYLIKEGDEINDLALKEAYSDSLVFAYQEDQRTFYKQ